jgi:nucleotide-binding universal stress UspA family protein
MSTNEIPVIVMRALAVAKRAPVQVVHVICVAEPHTGVPSLPTPKVDCDYAGRVQEAVAHTIENELREASATPRIHFFDHARIGDLADEILALAREVGADLVIVSNKGARGLERLLLGSVSEKVVREAGCTVEVARPKTYEHVDLLVMREVKRHGHYVPPHCYHYEDNRMILRPNEWPIP